MTRPVSLGVAVCVYELIGDDAVALVWETDQTAAELIAEFTARWGRPIGESTAPFDPSPAGQPGGVVITYDGGVA